MDWLRLICKYYKLEISVKKTNVTVFIVKWPVDSKIIINE